MRRAGDTNFFCHRTFPPDGYRLSGPAARSDGNSWNRRGERWEPCPEDELSTGTPPEMNSGVLLAGLSSRTKKRHGRQTVRNGDPGAENQRLRWVSIGRRQPQN